MCFCYAKWNTITGFSCRRAVAAAKTSSDGASFFKAGYTCTEENNPTFDEVDGKRHENCHIYWIEMPLLIAWP
jgi:hypothetical protein